MSVAQLSKPAAKAAAGASRLVPKRTLAPRDDVLEREAERNAVPASVGTALAGAGSPLEPALQEDFGRRFGRDLSHVRVHTGQAASDSAQALGARAYTTGNNIVFGDGQFAPGTGSGKRLLAHELAHTIQQDAAPGVPGQLIQRELVVGRMVEEPAPVVLSMAQLLSAVHFNALLFTDAAEIEILRDVIGVPKQPAIFDEAFINALVWYQSSMGVTPNGRLDPATAEWLALELSAEADELNEPATGTPMRRVARRMQLRAMTSRNLGRVTQQEFIGPDDNPTSAVTTRIGDEQNGNANMISLEHTGENSDAVNWLQFISMQMYAQPPDATAPVFNTGSIRTTGAVVTWSNASATHWFVDAMRRRDGPFYNVSGFLSTRTAGANVAMFDEPGGPKALPAAQAFTAPGTAAAGANIVTMRMGFAAYVVSNDRASYHVDWSGTTIFNVGMPSTSEIIYRQGAAGPVGGLLPEHRTALLAAYPRSRIE